MTKATPEIKATADKRNVRVTINGLTHLLFERERFVSMQSWLEKKTAEFVIEMTFKGGVTMLSYDSRDKWQVVLSELDRVLSGY